MLRLKTLGHLGYCGSSVAGLVVSSRIGFARYDTYDPFTPLVIYIIISVKLRRVEPACEFSCTHRTISSAGGWPPPTTVATDRV